MSGVYPLFIVSYVVRGEERRWTKKMARQPLPFGAAAGPGWFGPPLIALDAGMDLVSTLARAPDPWTGRFWPYAEACLLASLKRPSPFDPAFAGKPESTGLPKLLESQALFRRFSRRSVASAFASAFASHSIHYSWMRCIHSVLGFAPRFAFAKSTRVKSLRV